MYLIIHSLTWWLCELQRTQLGRSHFQSKSKYNPAGLGYELVSTGGSAKAIEEAGFPVTRVEELTGFPEMLDGKHF